ncbi:large subunit ribosomal protein L1 [Roseimicrobium gellanilyticum]|jgi:large subunit ribosomal protein L1|uniref:Large ribosomal subunit protein uL1 n=1 Tax=Roseimicrobium gellanilyticum TaxID=748857 RepID=A0A366HK35_9BACT|nr:MULTISPECIES: 50S ribosomal protein L1 [Roseimicrobium]QIF00441.1 50S ribosomal protein L1 [Roseimicrobium sp. ORNL1]RBP42369.1 large subunit ribosomal protein L1 [Roseimicrobium gellanilyticum]
MKQRSKRYNKAAEMVPADKLFSLEEAAELIKKLPTAKFSETVSLSFKLTVDPKKSDQMVRGTCPLPNGSGKSVKVAVFAQGDAAAAAKAAGAEIVGYEDLIAKVKDGFTDFDVAIATPAAMTEVRKLGKQLGPRGLMPNPKTGTVTDDTAGAVKAVKAGRADFKLDKNGNIAAGIGKVSFDAKALVENGNALIEAVMRARPASAKGRYVASITLASTMSPGVKVDVTKYLKIAA